MCIKCHTFLCINGVMLSKLHNCSLDICLNVMKIFIYTTVISNINMSVIVTLMVWCTLVKYIIVVLKAKVNLI